MKDKFDNSIYAIKVIPLNKLHSFKEAQKLSKLNHENIVRYYDCWKYGYTYFIKIEYIADGTLR